MAKNKVEETKIKNKGGRPTDYKPENIELVCHAIATNAKGLKRLCDEDPNMPGWNTIKTWIRKYPEFRSQYMQAKEQQSHVLMDITLDISMRDETDETADNLIKINRDKLKIETLKFLGGRLNIKDYGDKKEHTVTVHESNKLINETRKNYVRDPDSGKEF